MDFKIGDKVSFYRMNYSKNVDELFQGIIVDIEEHSGIFCFTRYGLSIENNPYPFPVAYFYANELKKVLA